MAASPADVPFGGRLLNGSDRAGVASVDHHGVRHVFVPPSDGAIYALDVERKDAVLEPEIGSVLRDISAEVPLLTWTQIEVAAKLLDRPAHLMMRDAQRQGLAALLSDAGIKICPSPHATHWISIGRRA